MPREIQVHRSERRLSDEEWHAAVQEKRLKSVKFEVYPGLEMSAKSRKADDWEISNGKLRVVMGQMRFVFRPSLSQYAVKELCEARWLGPLVMETHNGVTYGRILYERPKEEGTMQQLAIHMSASEEILARVTFGPERITFSNEARNLLPEYIVLEKADGGGAVRIVPVPLNEVHQHRLAVKVVKAAVVQASYRRVRAHVFRWLGVDARSVKRLRRLPMVRGPNGSFLVRLERQLMHEKLEKIEKEIMAPESVVLNGDASLVQRQRERIQWLMELERARGQHMPQISEEIRLLLELERREI